MTALNAGQLRLCTQPNCTLDSHNASKPTTKQTPDSRVSQNRAEKRRAGVGAKDADMPAAIAGEPPEADVADTVVIMSPSVSCSTLWMLFAYSLFS